MVRPGTYNSEQIGRHNSYYKSASSSPFNDICLAFKGLFQVV